MTPLLPIEGPLARKRPPTHPFVVFLILLVCGFLAWVFTR